MKKALLALLCLIVATTAALSGRGGGGGPLSVPIQTVRFGFTPSITPFAYNSQFPTKQVEGDTWYSTWADDGNVYVSSNDTTQFGGTGSSNLNFHKLTLPVDGTTTGTTINTMASWGTGGQTGSDGATWKSGALYSVSGTLYWSLYRQFSGSSYCTGGLVYGAQIIKSTDHGVTWSPTPPSTAAPYTSPMFLDKHQFMAPVQYTNKDYVGNTVDNSGTYVYGMFVTLDGSSNAILGRVAIANIGNLSASDWTWYTGGDGMVNSNWVSGQGNAVPIPTLPSSVSIQYLPALNRYISISGGAVAAGCAVEISGDGFMTAYEAPHPWGPWTQVINQPPPEDYPYNFYFTAPVMTTVSGNTVSYLYSADFNTIGVTPKQGPPLGSNFYTMWIANIVLNDFPQTQSVGSCAQSIQFFNRAGPLDSTHHTAYDNMICGMVSDGTWQLLDILYIFATNTQKASLTNLVKIGTGTIGSDGGTPPTFQTDRGYTGTDVLNLGAASIKIPYVLDQASDNFTLNNSHVSLWTPTNTPAVNGGSMMGIGFTNAVEIADTWHDGLFYGALNDGNTTQAGVGGITGPATRAGHWMINRTGASLDTIYQNANVFATPNATVGAVANTCTTQESYGNFAALSRYVCTALPPFTRGSPQQIAMVSAGASMTAAQISNFYARLRTYMTAVGVP